MSFPSFFARKKPKKSWKQEIPSLAFFITIVLLVRSFFIAPVKIPSGSMIPSLLVGDQLILSKFSYGWCNYSIFGNGWIHYFSGRVGKLDPKRGDVVVFALPNNVKMDYVKRLAGLPGDEIELIDGVVYINGQKAALKEIEKDYKANDGESDITGTVYEETFPETSGHAAHTHLILKQKPFGQGQLDTMAKFTVPKDHYFFLGDNRDGSGDSRVLDSLGAVYKDYIIGPIWCVWLSLSTDWNWFKPWLWPFQIRYSRIGHWVH